MLLTLFWFPGRAMDDGRRRAAAGVHAAGAATRARGRAEPVAVRDTGRGRLLPRVRAGPGGRPLLRMIHVIIFNHF